MEKPQNGIAGLKHWRQDLLAGFLVALASTPFSIGIAVASGAPPITGLTSAIIAGLVLPFLGGSFVTISGPAAGLAPALYAALLTLGHGDLKAGYPLLLPVILAAGLIQIVFSQLKAARFSAFFPVPVVEGMLAAIGLMIIVKQVPTLMGHAFLAHDFWGILSEIPTVFPTANMPLLALGLGILALIFGLNHLGQRFRWIQVVSPQLLAVAVGTLIAHACLSLRPQDLIHIPANPLAEGITFPDFAALLQRPELWVSAATIAITLALIDGIESLATIHAIDKIDPYRRQSNPDKTLFAMGVSNLCSSLVGGLTIIPGAVKSTANIMAGGRTQWANFYNACFLLLFLLVFSQAISQLPLVVLSAVLIYTGYKLCKPQVWFGVFRSGGEQLGLFAFTALVTLTTDLMWGILAGIACAFVINVGMVWQACKTASGEPMGLFPLIRNLFQNPVTRRGLVGEEYHLTLSRPLVCFNYWHLVRELNAVPSSAQAHKVLLHITDGVLIIDHSIMDHLAHWMMRYQAENHGEVEIIGLDQMRKLAVGESSSRIFQGDYQPTGVAG